MSDLPTKSKSSPTGRFQRGSAPDGMLELGKVPPQAVDLEEAVLGAMMIDKTAVSQVIDTLKSESFYKDAHQKIFEVMRELFDEAEPIDILTVGQRLKKKAELDMVGGSYYIAQLTSRVASAANVETHARIVSQKYMQRELIRIGNKMIKQSYEDSLDVFDLLDSAEGDLYQVAEGNIRKGYRSMKEVMREAVDNIEAARKNVDGVSGVPTGFSDLDRITGGWQPSDMVVLAARPGMGKTAFVLSMARNMAVDFNQAVAVFSLEMSAMQLVQRLIASETEISADKLRKGDLEEHEYQQLHDRISRLEEAQIYINDTAGLSIFELRAQCRRLKAKYGIGLVIIDYLQLMTAGSDNKGNREQEISTISRTIKGIAKELDVPIIALSQLSRSVETRGGEKRPILSDLRESGAIEQDADIVTFIYRPEYYGLDEDSEGNPTAGVGELIIAKHRNGALGTVKLRFIGRLAKFTNLDAFDDGMGFGGAMKPNEKFEEVPTITVSSKLNTMEDDDVPDVDQDDPPF